MIDFKGSHFEREIRLCRKFISSILLSTKNCGFTLHAFQYAVGSRKFATEPTSFHGFTTI